jgi:AcrR family transcriptional regulator
MGRRSTQVAQTRERIVAAAADLFAQRGARATTMTEVARMADVSTATVTNHFATQDLLIEAVVAHLMALIEVPGEEIFAGATSVAARLKALTEAMFGFFDRTWHWFYLLGEELTEVAAVADADARFKQSVQRLHEMALTGSGNPLLPKVAAGLIHPATLSALKSAGMSVDEASAVVADFLAHQARTKQR